jgi:hypothetical protein
MVPALKQDSGRARARVDHVSIETACVNEIVISNRRRID